MIPAKFQTRRRTLSRVIAVLTLAPCYCAPVMADSQYPEGSHRKLIESMEAAESDAYREIVAGFDEYLATAPDDVIAEMERCRFISDFAYREETTVESAYDDSEACIEDLKHGEQLGRPEVQLFLLEQKWGDEAVNDAEALLRTASDWPTPRRAALHARLSDLYADRDEDKSGRHATIAVTLDPATAVQIAAADFQVRIGAKRKAVELVRTLPEESWDAWTLQQAVDVVLRAGDPRSAYGLVTSRPGIELNLSTRFSLARALLDLGEAAAGHAMVDGANERLQGEDTVAFGGYRVLRELFELRRDFGTAAEATAAYQALRDAGWRADPFGWYRLSLATVFPREPVRTRDLLGAGSLLLALALIAALPLLLLVPIHYRSVVKRLRGTTLPDRTATSPWGLGQMWYAMAALLTLMSLAAYVVAYPLFEDLLAPAFDEYPAAPALVESSALGRAYLLGNVLCLLAMIPLLRGMGRANWVGTRWRPWRALLVGAGAGLGLVVVAAMFRGFLGWRGVAVGPGSETFRAMQGVDEAFGPWALVIFACVLTPLLEEFVFRGVVLRTCARHLTLWAAVLIQAAIFVLWHEDVGDFPVLFLFALCGAWLTLRSGGLVAPIAFHAVVNLLAVSAILNFSRLVEPGG